MRLERFGSPVGDVLMVTADERVRAVDFAGNEARLDGLLRQHWGASARETDTDASAARRAIERYFAGDIAAVDAVAVETGGTAFQRSVWRALREIPAGETWSYARLAAHVGSPKACRAVGLANSRNPVSIIVPCHRVTGSNGSLTGYAGGLDRKAWLLQHESRFRIG